MQNYEENTRHFENQFVFQFAISLLHFIDLETWLSLDCSKNTRRKCNELLVHSIYCNPKYFKAVWLFENLTEMKRHVEKYILQSNEADLQKEVVPVQYIPLHHQRFEEEK